MDEETPPFGQPYQNKKLLYVLHWTRHNILRSLFNISPLLANQSFQVEFKGLVNVMQMTISMSTVSVSPDSSDL